MQVPEFIVMNTQTSSRAAKSDGSALFFLVFFDLPAMLSYLTKKCCKNTRI